AASDGALQNNARARIGERRKSCIGWLFQEPDWLWSYRNLLRHCNLRTGMARVAWLRICSKLPPVLGRPGTAGIAAAHRHERIAVHAGVVRRLGARARRRNRAADALRRRPG